MGLSHTTSYDGAVYGAVLALFAICFFLLILFAWIFGKPMTEEQHRAYLKENWPTKYEELVVKDKP